MATENVNTATPAAKPSFEYGVETDNYASASFGQGVEPGFQTRNGDGLSMEINRDGTIAEKVAEDLKENGEAGGKEQPSEETVKEAAEAVLEEGGTEANTEGAAAPLGDWKVGDAALQDKFDARYFKSGELNQEVLSKEFWANHAKDGADKAGLNASTYDYLKDTLGLSKDTIKSVERALVAEAGVSQQQFYEKVGGKDRFEAAVKWGREGGYTPAQRERFNKLREKGGADFEDAVEALMARYQKANPKAVPEARRGPPPQQQQQTERRRSAPERSATSGGSTSSASGAGASGDTFASHAEYQTAWGAGLKAQKAAATPADKRAAKDHLDVLRRKARRSKFG